MNNDMSNAEMQASALVIARDTLLETWKGRHPSLDPIDALLVATVTQANLEPATSSLENQLDYSALDQTVPDASRRPISISRLADSMDLRFETVRRRVNRLKGLGVFTTEPSGIVVPEQYFLTSHGKAAVQASDDLAERTYWRLVSINYFTGDPLPPPALRPAQHPYRAVSRLMLSFSLRMLAEFKFIGGDYLNLLLLMQLQQLNTMHLGDQRKSTPDSEQSVSFIRDERRVPVSIATLSRESGVPFETIRRRLRNLAERGVCSSGEHGYIIPSAVIDDFAKSAVQNRMNFIRLYRSCALVGAIESWETRMEVRTAS